MGAYAKARIAVLPRHPTRVGFSSLVRRVDTARINEDLDTGCTLLQAVDLLERLLVLDPARRLTAAQAIEHPFLARFRSPEYAEQRFNPASINHTTGACDCFLCVEPRTLSTRQQLELLRSASKAVQ
jgi:serine/threonine protein kinase